MKHLLVFAIVILLNNLAYSYPVSVPQVIKNATMEDIIAEYKLCQFDWDEVKKKKYNVNCNQKGSFNLKSGESKEFDLRSYKVPNSNLLRYSDLFIGKIKSARKFQYFLADWFDVGEYVQYKENTSKSRVLKSASSCVLVHINSTNNIYIYSNNKGFQCVDI